MAEEPEVKTVVTKREDMTTKKELNEVGVIAMPGWQIVLIRALRVYLQGVLGFLTANTSGLTEAVTGIPIGDFGNHLLIALSLAIAPATLSLLQNALELLAKLDQTRPTFRA